MTQKIQNYASVIAASSNGEAAGYLAMEECGTQSATGVNAALIQQYTKR